MSTDIRRVMEAEAESNLARIRQHPFIESAHLGDLTKSQAERWIKCAGRESRSFPTILENMIEFTSNATVKRILEENLLDEYGNGNAEQAHFKHYLQLLDHLGIPRVDFYSYEEGPSIRLALSMAYNISKANNPGLALGYMIVNEGMTPITYEAARAALVHYYHTLNTTFFDLHIDVDAHHVEELYRAADHMSDSDVLDMKFGVLAGERGMAVLLDEALGLFDFVRDLPRYEAV